MNLNSDNRPSLEELKRRNLPPEAPPLTERMPQMETHPSEAEWQELRQILWTMGEVLGEQTVILEDLSQRLSLIPRSEQAERLGRETALVRSLLEQGQKETMAIRTLLEQVGRKNGKRSLIR